MFFIGQLKMNEKLLESVQYLKCCNILETETFRLYETLSKKFNQPENSFILGFAYDSLKCAKIIQGILDYFDMPEIEKMTCKKNLAELANSISDFSKRISKINNLNYETSCEILKDLSDLEDRLSEVYNNYLGPSGIQVISVEFSKLAVSISNFKKIFETFAEEKQKHKETIIEIIYCFETKEAERLRNTTPIIKYNNPDSWIHDSTLHAFSSTPVKENTEP
jgi:hypothetical protein